MKVLLKFIGAIGAIGVLIYGVKRVLKSESKLITSIDSIVYPFFDDENEE